MADPCRVRPNLWLNIAPGQEIDGTFRAPSQLRAHRHPFVRQRGAGKLPSVVDLPHNALVGDEHLVEEDLVEQRVTGHLPERTYVDPGRLHVDQEVGDSAVGCCVPIGARQADAPVRVVRP
jgi:hypothetical protein